MQKIIKEQVKEQVKVQVSKILPKIEQTMNEQLEAEVLTRLSNSSKTSYAVAADLSEMELKKILIEKIEGNKSIHRSNEQMNLYKALVEAYESDKIILDTYGDTVTLKRRHDDDDDKDEEPSAGPDRGSKRRKEGKEPESASSPKEKATRSAGKKLNEAIRKDHFPLPFMDQMLERLAENGYYCFLDGFSGYFQIPIDPKDQEKTTFTCPYGTFAYKCMPFGLCNAPGTFQRCMMAIFHDMIEKTME
nr:reverse transcriptase domain-containing protein [Tanacetum cinerariifolium]